MASLSKSAPYPIIIYTILIQYRNILLIIAFYLILRLGQLHIVEYPKYNSEEITPPMWLKRLAVRFHDLKHHS